MFKSIFLAVAFIGSISALGAEYLVKFTPQGYSTVLSQHGLLVKELNTPAHLLKVDIPKKNEAEVIEQLYLRGGIEYIVPNARVHAFAERIEPNLLKEQWHLSKIKAQEAWQKAGNHGSRKVIIAVIDTGVDYRHESLVDNMVQGYDFHQDDSDPMDITSNDNPGHGTHCAGIIGATGVIAEGTYGISPEVSIMPIRFLGEDGGGDLNNAIKAIDFAISKGVSVISASWGAAIGKSQATPLIEAIDRAGKAGVIFVAAASNDGKNNDSYEVYPANAELEHFISVAASGPNDEKPSWSNYGQKKVHLASPGLNIMSTIPNGKYQNMSGTSMATPLVAGLIAFLKAQDPSLTGAQVKAILQTTGATVDINTQCNCRIDALAATELVVDKKMYMVPAAGTIAPNGTLNITGYNGGGSYHFTSSNESVLKVSENGKFVAGQNGDAVITMTDSNGSSVQSKTFHVGNSAPPDQPDNPIDGKCPFDDPATCQMICGIMPDAPWCKAL